MHQFNYPSGLGEVRKRLGDGCTIVVSEKKNGCDFVAYAVRHVSNYKPVKEED